MADLSLFDLTGKKALVTGGAVGIGRGYATALAMAGADVAIVDLDEETAGKTCEGIRAMGRDSMAIRCDVTDKDQVQAMVAKVAERFGRLDIGVNNAGIAILGADEELEQRDWDKVIAVNLTGVFLCAQAEAQQMIRQMPVEGKIINTASMSARIAELQCLVRCVQGGDCAHDANAGGGMGPVQHQRQLYQPELHHDAHARVDAAYRARAHSGIDASRPRGASEDLYGAVVFLASAASNYVTGHDLLVDGGHTLNAWLTPLSRELPPRVSPEEESGADEA